VPEAGAPMLVRTRLALDAVPEAGAPMASLESSKLEMRCSQVKLGNQPEIRIPKSETNPNLEWPKS